MGSEQSRLGKLESSLLPPDLNIHPRSPSKFWNAPLSRQLRGCSTQQKTRSPFNSLPEDLHRLIGQDFVLDPLDVLQSQYRRFDELESQEFLDCLLVDTASLRALALTSTTLYARISPMLYRNVYIRSVKSLCTFTLALFRRPWLRQHVRTIYTLNIPTHINSFGSLQWQDSVLVRKIGRLMRVQGEEDVHPACKCHNRIHLWTYRLYYAMSLCPEIMHVGMPTYEVDRDICSACEEECRYCTSLLRRIVESNKKLQLVAVHDTSQLTHWKGSSVRRLHLFELESREVQGGHFLERNARWARRCLNPDELQPSEDLRESSARLTHLTIDASHLFGIGTKLLHTHMPALSSLSIHRVNPYYCDSLQKLFGSAVFPSVTALRVHGGVAPGAKIATTEMSLEERFPRLELLGVASISGPLQLFEVGLLPASVRTVELLTEFDCIPEWYFSHSWYLQYLLPPLTSYAQPNVVNICMPTSLEYILSDFLKVARTLGAGTEAVRSQTLVDAMEVLRVYVKLSRTLEERGQMLCTNNPGQRLVRYYGIDPCPLKGHEGLKFPCSSCFPRPESYTRTEFEYDANDWL